MKPTNLPEYIANFLPTKEHKLNITFCCHDEDKGEMTALISLQDEKGQVVLTPFSQTGTYDSFNGLEKDGTPAKYLNGSGGLWPSLYRLKTVLAEADNFKLLEAELEEKKKALKLEEEKLKKAPKANGNRCAGSLDEEILKNLVTVPAGDTNFKKALEEANLLTLLRAIETLKTAKGGKSKFARLSSEMKKVTGTTAEDMGHVYEPDESATNEEAETSVHPQQMSLLGQWRVIMAMEIKGLPRTFELETQGKTVVLSDPNPSASVDTVRRLFSDLYPELVSATVIGPTITPESVAYKFSPKAGTKG